MATSIKNKWTFREDHRVPEYDPGIVAKNCVRTALDKLDYYKAIDHRLINVNAGDLMRMYNVPFTLTA